MSAIGNFAAAYEAQRCIEALDCIENTILACAKSDIANLGLERPEIGGVADSLIGSLTDAVGDSGLHAMRRELRDAIDAWEEAA